MSVELDPAHTVDGLAVAPVGADGKVTTVTVTLAQVVFPQLPSYRT